MNRKIFFVAFALFSVFVIVALCLISGAYGEEKEGYYVLCRPGSAVNVRNKPKKDAFVVGWVEFGRFVHTDGKERNGFVHVIDLAAETTEGWIYAGFLVDEQPRKEKYKAEVWGGRVIARSCVNGKRLKTLREGQTVTVYAQTNRWAVTNRGYIMCDWLRGVE